MPDLEFKLLSDIAPVRDMTILANFDEVKAQLQEIMQPYSKLILSEEDIPEAKNTLARIRKVEKVLDDYRKSVKKDFMQPVTAFEEKVKELLAECYEPETNLSEQINRYTEQRKAEKLAALKAYFDENVGEMAAFLSYAQVENPRWGNVTFSLEAAQTEIKQAIDTCADGVEAIRGMGSEFEATLLDHYRKTHDLAGAMKMNGELAAMKRREEERKEAQRKREEEARAAQEAARKAAEERRAREAEELRRQMAAMPREPEPPAVEPEPEVQPEKQVQVYSITFKVQATREQLIALKDACDRIGIRIMRV